MGIKEQIAAKTAELKALKAKIEANDADAIAQGEALQTEIQDLQKQLKQMEAKARLINFIGVEKANDTGDEAPAAKSLGEHFVNHLKNQQVEGKNIRVYAPEFKSSSDVQKTPTATGVDAYATTFDRNVVTGARVPLVIRELFGAETISGSTLVYLVEGAMEGAPAVTAEGAKKPQVHFADPTKKTVSLKKVAEFIKESDEYIHDYAFLATAINGRLLYNLALTEQNMLVYDLLHTDGIQSDSTHWTAATKAAELADLILGAAMDIQEETGFAANAFAIHPKDWYGLLIGKDNDNRYYGGGYFGSQDARTVWGLTPCVTTAVNQGEIIVGAWKTCASVVQSGGVSVDATNSDVDDFQKNLMTIRAEERLALAVRRPKGFKVITKGAGGATGATGA